MELSEKVEMIRKSKKCPLCDSRLEVYYPEIYNNTHAYLHCREWRNCDYILKVEGEVRISSN